MKTNLKLVPRNCAYCSQPIPLKRRADARHCSATCKQRDAQGRPLDAAVLSKSAVGAMSELVVCADLLKRGFEVFRSVSPTASCDIVISRRDSLRCFRVEVKTTWRARNGSIVFGQIPVSDKFDVFAFFVQNTNEVIYQPTLDTLESA